MTITYSLTTGNISIEDLLATSKQAHDFFDTDHDDTQIPPTSDTRNWILSHPYSINVIKDDDTVIGFAFAFPCTEPQKRDFEHGRSNERKLFENAKKNSLKTCTTLYFCSIYLMPRYRGKGVAMKAASDLITSIEARAGKQLALFYQPFTKEGARFMEALKKQLGRN